MVLPLHASRGFLVRLVNFGRLQMKWVPIEAWSKWSKVSVVLDFSRIWSWSQIPLGLRMCVRIILLCAVRCR